MPAKSSHNTEKWNSRRSELAGYTVSVYKIDAMGIYVRADVGPEVRKIRLLVEDRNESVYCSVIENGSIVSELVNGSPNAILVKKIISAKCAVFKQLPSDYIRLINGHYGIFLKRILNQRKQDIPVSLFFFSVHAFVLSPFFLLQGIYLDFFKKSLKRDSLNYTIEKRDAGRQPGVLNRFQGDRI